MRKLKVILFLVFVVQIHGFKLNAQESNSRKEKIENLKIAYITKQLTLTSEEAKVFWPIYDELQLKLENNRKNFKSQFNSEKTEFQTDKEAETFLQADFSMRTKEIELQKEYAERLKKVIPVKKVAKLRQAEEGFKKEILRAVREREKDRKTAK